MFSKFENQSLKVVRKRCNSQWILRKISIKKMINPQIFYTCDLEVKHLHFNCL